MIVEQSDGVVVVEGALSAAAAEALIRYIQANYPNKPVKFVTGSHHHADHSGGMRPFVALGARPVVHANAVSFFSRVFAHRDSQLLPDRLDGSTVTAKSCVPGDRLGDAARPGASGDRARRADRARDDHDPGPRAERGVLFVNGDTYTPGPRPVPGRGRSTRRSGRTT